MIATQSHPLEAGLVSGEDFWESGDYRDAELVSGRVVKKMPGVFDHGECAGRVFVAFYNYLRRQKIGRASTDALFRVERDPDSILAPDVCFVSNADLEGENTAKYVEKAPTLAVEVRSQNDTMPEVREKAAQYLAHGTRLVWAVLPKTRQVLVFLPDDGETLLSQSETLSAEEILPGFSLSVSEIFED